MNALDVMRTLGALAAVLGLLVFALWVVRRFGLIVPGSLRSQDSRLRLIEKLALDRQRVVFILRHDDKEHLILAQPSGLLVLDQSPSVAQEVIGIDRKSVV